MGDGGSCTGRSGDSVSVEEEVSQIGFWTGMCVKSLPLFFGAIRLLRLVSSDGMTETCTLIGVYDPSDPDKIPAASAGKLIPNLECVDVSEPKTGTFTEYLGLRQSEDCLSRRKTSASRRDWGMLVTLAVECIRMYVELAVRFPQLS